VRSKIIFDEADPEQTPTEKEPQAEFEKVKPLAEEIIDTLVDLLFLSEFTLPKVTADKNKVMYAIWQSGVGCNTPVASTKEFESSWTEISRLLFILVSKSMYMLAGTHCTIPPARLSQHSVGILPVKGVKAITYIATCPDKQVVLSVLCSLLNTVSALVCDRVRTLTLVDPEVQPYNMARAIRSRSIQSLETDPRHILTPTAACTNTVPYTRVWQRQRPGTEELLSPFPWPPASATRFSVSR
jgi:hypothetical protein